MTPTAYEAPSIELAGSLHDLTLQFKTFGGADGVILAPTNVTIGESQEDGTLIS